MWLVDVLGEVFLILRGSSFVFKIAVGHDVWFYAKGAERFNAIHIQLNRGVETDQNIAHDFVRLDVARYLSEFISEVNRRQIPCDMNVSAQAQFVEPVCLLFVHYPYVNSMQVHFLPGFDKVVNSTLLVGVGKKVVVKHLYPLAFGI